MQGTVTVEWLIFRPTTPFFLKFASNSHLYFSSAPWSQWRNGIKSTNNPVLPWIVNFVILSDCSVGNCGKYCFTTGKKIGVFLKKSAKNYKPAIRSIVPSRIPNIDVDADNMPKRIYPTIIPIFSGM
jgi:hypothetical protein